MFVVVIEFLIVNEKAAASWKDGILASLLAELMEVLTVAQL